MSVCWNIVWAVWFCMPVLALTLSGCDDPVLDEMLRNELPTQAEIDQAKID